MQLRVGLVAAIYNKTLRLPSVGGRHSITSGYVTNLASNDVERFVSTAVTCVFMIWGPIMAILILLVGIHIIGRVFAVGYVLLLVRCWDNAFHFIQCDHLMLKSYILQLLIPFQLCLGRYFVSFRSKIAAITDKRVNLVSIILGSVKPVSTF